jgi:hypothetical protein
MAAKDDPNEKWRKLGERIGEQIGRALASLIPADLGEQIREACAAAYGRCRVCSAPLSGHSPEQICTTCHADELLARMNDESAEEREA